MNHNLDLNNRPFQAIKAGAKKIEGRTPKNSDDKRYEEMVVGDTITFTNNITNEIMTVGVLFVHHYYSTREMLETEGIKNVLSSGLDIEGGIKSYNSFNGYKKRIEKYGIYAIGIKVK